MTSSEEPAVPTITAVRLSGAADREEHPLLVLGPPVGSTALAAWADVASGLGDAFDVLAWDLPGHGYNAPAPAGAPEPTPATLAAGVVRVVDDVLAQRGELGRACFFAGVGLGGEVAVHLAEHEPERVLVALRLDDVAPERRAAVLRRELLGESGGDEVSADSGSDSGALDERSRALVALVVASVTGRDGAVASQAARAAGLSRAEVDEALAHTARLTAGGARRPAD